MQSKQIVINDLLLNYYVNIAADSKPNLVFLHGWGSDSIYWTKIFIPDFLKKYNIYCLDLPGFAKSQIPNFDLDVSKFGEFVNEFISKLELKKVILIGHSLGGRIAIKLAIEGPSHIQKIVLVNAAGIYHTSKTTSLISKVGGVVSPIFKLGFMQGLRKKIYKILKSEDYLNNPAMRNTFVNVVQEGLEPFLGQITLPTLIIWGEKDENEYTPVSDAYKMQKYIRGSKLVVLKDAKHYSFLDKPKEFIKALDIFIEPK